MLASAQVRGVLAAVNRAQVDMQIVHAAGLAAGDDRQIASMRGAIRELRTVRAAVDEIGPPHGAMARALVDDMRGGVSQPRFAGSTDAFGAWDVLQELDANLTQFHSPIAPDQIQAKLDTVGSLISGSRAELGTALDKVAAYEHDNSEAMSIVHGDYGIS
jgi:hypothetical protein